MKISYFHKRVGVAVEHLVRGTAAGVFEMKRINHKIKLDGEVLARFHFENWMPTRDFVIEWRGR